MIFGLGSKKSAVVTAEEALPGRDTSAFEIQEEHAVLGTSMVPPYPSNLEVAIFALGCFWGPERTFWGIDGVYTTAALYAGGFTKHPTYKEVCTGNTGHAEAVLVVYDPEIVTYRDLLKTYWESHDPTQVMRQGNDIGSQYRSAIFYTTDSQRRDAEETRAIYQTALASKGYGSIVTEILPADSYYFAEPQHQQYLHKVPDGYCGSGGTGVSCAIGLGVTADEGLDSIPTTDEEWRQRLTPEQYHVLRQAGTEPPFAGEYVDTEEDGIYRCAGCGNPLFDSSKKYHSGSGWPSFTEIVSPDAVEVVEDRSYGMVRTEVRCSRCHSHLGHVFNDGPREAGGERWCMNSLSLDLDER